MFKFDKLLLKSQKTLNSVHSFILFLQPFKIEKIYKNEVNFYDKAV